MFDTLGLKGSPRNNAELVFDEIIANIIRYGAPDGRELAICVALEPSRDTLVLVFEDNGVPFDPRAVPDSPPQKSLEEARIGGYGVMLVRQAASSLDYLRTPEGHNQLTVRVRTQP